MLLPSEGVCHGCYILAYCAGLDAPPSFLELIERSRRLPCGESFFRDLVGLACALLEAGILVEEHGRMRFIPEFPKCRNGADRNTKMQIAKLLLARSRPNWLPLSADADRVAVALMPTGAQDALAWMGRDLVHVLQSVLISEHRHFSYAAMGTIGEEVILAAERNAGRRVRHMSPISDSYGYDIESVSGADIRYIEVKCTVEQKAGRFFLSRNEYEQSVRLGATWVLVQVVLRSEPTWIAQSLDADSIRAIRCVPAVTLAREIVTDETHCRWQESVEFHIPDQTWIAYPYCLPDGWRIVNPLVFPVVGKSQGNVR